MKDLIERQAALDALEWKWVGKAAFDAIKALPSAQPERKRGQWIRGIGEYAKKLMECSECRRTFYYNAEWNFCPHCGAKMEVDDGSD